MPSRILTGAIVLVSGLAVGAAVTGSSAGPALKWANVNLKDTVSIAGVFVTGPVTFVHDDAKMARGEPCTGVYRLVPGKGPGEEIVSFHCKPRFKRAPDVFTSAISSTPYGPRMLTEYQFAGDEEAHGVPRNTQ